MSTEESNPVLVKDGGGAFMSPPSTVAGSDEQEFYRRPLCHVLHRDLCDEMNLYQPKHMVYLRGKERERETSPLASHAILPPSGLIVRIKRPACLVEPSPLSYVSLPMPPTTQAHQFNRDELLFQKIVRVN